MGPDVARHGPTLACNPGRKEAHGTPMWPEVGRHRLGAWTLRGADGDPMCADMGRHRLGTLTPRWQMGPDVTRHRLGRLTLLDGHGTRYDPTSAGIPGDPM